MKARTFFSVFAGFILAFAFSVASYATRSNYGEYRAYWQSYSYDNALASVYEYKDASYSEAGNYVAYGSQYREYGEYGDNQAVAYHYEKAAYHNAAAAADTPTY